MAGWLSPGEEIGFVGELVVAGAGERGVFDVADGAEWGAAAPDDGGDVGQGDGVDGGGR
ncbi:MAG: hypothetical protein U0232_18600 [Thermomicrobiales bacterium]